MGRVGLASCNRRRNPGPRQPLPAASLFRPVPLASVVMVMVPVGAVSVVSVAVVVAVIVSMPVAAATVATRLGLERRRHHRYLQAQLARQLVQHVIVLVG